MKINSYLSEGARLELTAALLLYSSPGQQMATVHKILRDEERCSLLPGECLTRESIENLLQSLHKTKTARSILPPEALCATSGVLCWWKAAHRAPVFFNTNTADFNAELNGAEVLHPPLVFLAKPGRLQIFALEENERPAGETTLCRAPYYNLYANNDSGDGVMCRGNIRLPEVCLPRDIPIWERGFFETNFTHSNLHQAKITRHPGGHDGLWRVAKEWGEEPFVEGCAHARYLVPLKLTLEQAVNT